MDKKRFVINLISNFLSVISGLGLSFFLTPYLVETLGKEAYGFYPLSNISEIEEYRILIFMNLKTRVNIRTAINLW